MIEIDYLTLPLILVIVLVAQYSLVRKELRSLFDPMLYFVISTSFALTFSILFLQDWNLISRIALYFCFFWTGYKSMMSTVPMRSHVVLQETPHSIVPAGGFPIFCILLTAVYLVANLAAWSASGVPLFSADPSLQKIESLTGGLGVIRRFNWGAGVFTTLAALYWYIHSRRKTALICLATAAVVAIFGGGKSALVTVLFGMGLYIHRPFLDSKNREWSKWLRGKSLIFVAAGALPVALILIIEANEDANALTGLMIRLLYFGDSLLYWGKPEVRDHFSTIHPAVSYLSHILNPILGFLRVQAYENPIGNEFVQYSLRAGEELSGSLGPNTPFYVKGELFFGPWFATIYAFAVGFVFASFRRNFVSAQRISLTKYTFLASLVVIGMTTPTEDSLFVGRLFDLLLLLPPLYLIARLIYWGTRPRIRNAIAD